jgi:DNA-binding response OmpR family regulator
LQEVFVFKRRTRVLLVEDSRALRLTLADILRIAGIKVDTAPDASAAFGKLGHRRYDVAIVDMVLLPGPSGIEVIRSIRSNSPATRVFACTAYYEGDLLAETRALGVERVIHKPVDPGLLVQLIQRPPGPARKREGPNLEATVDGCVA